MLMDINMPDLNGIEGSRQILSSRPGLGIIMVAMLEDFATVHGDDVQQVLVADHG
jgi:DNA-binding NarL/FixJ family response regulator